MSKLALIIKREYVAKVRNKSFVIMTFLSPFLIVGMITFIVYLAQVNKSDTPVIGVLNESDFFAFRREQKKQIKVNARTKNI